MLPKYVRYVGLTAAVLVATLLPRVTVVNINVHVACTPSAHPPAPLALPKAEL